MKQKFTFLLFLLTTTFLYLQAQTLRQLDGKITDAQNNPVAGASVRLLNTSHAAVSGTSGEFSFRNLPSGQYTVQVSGVGFATIAQQVTVNNSAGTVTFVLPSTSKQLDEVVVSAQKREEVLQRLPLSVTALTAKQVQDFRLWDTKELTAIVPGLYSDDPGDKRNVTSLRGIATTSYDPAVATYVDGVNQFSLDTYISPLFDVERIEVLRGPQGTLYGRNAMAGVINIITKQPTNQTGVFAEGTIGNRGQQRYSAGFKAPLVKNKLFFGAAGLYDRFNGFYTNDYNHSKYDKQQTAGGNYYLRYLPGNNWDLDLNVKHSNNRNNGPFPLVMGADQALSEPFHLSQNATTTMVDNTFNTSLSVNHHGRSFNFGSQTAYQSNYRYYKTPIDADFSPLDILTVINNYGSDWNKVKVWTQEFRFTNSAASVSPLQWTAGMYFFSQDNPKKQASHFGNDAGLFGAPDINFSLINTTKAKAHGGAVYAQATYGVTSRLDLIGGLRYDRETKKQSVFGEYQKDPDPTPLFPYRTDTSTSVSFNAFSPKLGLSYRASANNTLFATYSRGFRAGGLTELSSQGDASQPPLYAYKPEYSNNLEAGIKNKIFNNRLTFNLTAFYATITDAQVPTLVLPDAVTITRNTGKLESKGVETEIAAAPTEGLTVLHSLGYTNAKFQNLSLSENGNTVDLKGNRQVFTPDLTSMLAVQYSLRLIHWQDFSFVVRGEWKYIGTQYFDLANTIKQAPYNLYNARAGFTAKNFSAVFWMRNLFNQKYIGYAYDFGAVNLGNPKMYGVTAGVKF